MQFLLLLIALSLVQQESVSSSPQQPTDKKTAKSTVKTTKLAGEMTLVNFGDADSGLFKGLLVVEKIRPSSSYTIEVDIFNPFDQTISFEAVQVSCNCGNVEFSDNQFVAEENQKAIVTFKTPPRSSTNQFGVTLTLFKDRKMREMAAILDVRGNMWGNLSIDNSKSVFTVSEENTAFLVPVNYSKPIDLKDIKIDKSGSVADLPVELKEIKGNTYLQFLAIPNVVGEDGITGRLTLSEEESGASDFLDIIVKKESECVCSPRIVRFRKKSGSEDESDLQARVIVQIPSNKNESDSDSESSSSDVRLAIQSCSLGDGSVGAIAKRLSNRVYRVIFTKDRNSLLENRAEKIELTLTWNLNGELKAKTFGLPFKIKP